MRPLSLFLLLSSSLAVACDGISLISISPDSVAAGGVVDVIGAGFVEGLAVRLEGDGGTVTLGVSVESDTTATATLPPSTPAGTYDVVASSTAGEARLLTQV